MRYRLIAPLTFALAGYPPENATGLSAGPSSQPVPAAVVDIHTSRLALDWAGMYEGLLACAECAGIHTQLNLATDGHFEILTRRLERDAAPSSARGKFDWAPDGKTIVLDAEGRGQRFAVGENRLLPLETGQVQPAWGGSAATLGRLPAEWSGSRTDLGDMLEEYRWTLVTATDSTNQSIDALLLDKEPSFSFTFGGSRLHVQGGCNGFRGAFSIDDADTMLDVTGGMGTLMACAAPLMEADATLSALMAEPLETVVVRGMQPSLVLLTPTDDALVLTGKLTPEARFAAPPTTVFLEVAADTVECGESVRGDGQCLQVRERTFDEHGLLVGTVAEWQAFTADIEGYRHEPGIRNVLRVKRFESASGPETPTQTIHVLDLLVESEVVP